MRQRFSRPPSRQFIRRIGSSIIVLSFVLLTACGKKSDFAVVHAVLSPPGDELPEEFTLVTPLEEKPFDVDGTAEARVRRNAVSLVAAVRPDGKMALMDIVVVDDSSSDVDVSLDATQTVRALAFLWPPNITLELTQANEVLKTIESDLFFSKAVSQFPKAWKELDPLRSSLSTPLDIVALGAQARLPEPPEPPLASSPTIASAQLLPLQLKYLSAQVTTEGDQLKLTFKAPDELSMDWIVEAIELDSGSPSFPQSREALAAVADPQALPTRPESGARALLSASVSTIGEETVHALALKLGAGDGLPGAQSAATIPFSPQHEAAYLVRASGRLAGPLEAHPLNGNLVVGANIARYYLDAFALTTDLRGGERESLRNMAASYIATLGVQIGQDITSGEADDATIRSQIYGKLFAVWNNLRSENSLSPEHNAELKFLSQLGNTSFSRISDAVGVHRGAAGFTPRLNTLRKVPVTESVIVVVGDPWSAAR